MDNQMSTTFNTDLEGFKRLTADFLKDLEWADVDGIENGQKCLALAYLGVNENGGDRDMAIAETYLNFANKKAAEKIIDLILSGKA